MKDDKAAPADFLLFKGGETKYELSGRAGVVLISTGEAGGSIGGKADLQSGVDGLKIRISGEARGEIILSFGSGDDIGWERASYKGRVRGDVSKSWMLYELTPPPVTAEPISQAVVTYIWFRTTVSVTFSPEIRVDLNLFPGNGNCITGLRGIDCNGNLGVLFGVLGEATLAEKIGKVEASVGIFAEGVPTIFFRVPKLAFDRFEIPVRFGAKVGAKAFGFKVGRKCDIRFCYNTAGGDCTAIEGPYGKWACGKSKTAQAPADSFAHLVSHSIEWLQTGARERILVRPVASGASPQIALSDQMALAVWVDEGEASDEILYAFSFDGLEFSEPQQCTRDALVDGQPDIAFDDQGNGLMVWARNPTPLTGDEPLQEQLSGFEIFYSRLAGLTQQWSAPRRLTDNDVLDGSPTLLKDHQGRLAVVWSRNRRNFPLPDRDHADEVYLAGWNGDGFDEPQLIRGDDRALGRSFAWSDDQLMYVWTEDGDNDFTTIGDQDLFYLLRQTDGAIVEGRISDDDLDDVNPQIIFDAAGQPLLVWTRLEKIITDEGEDRGWTHRLLSSSFTGDAWMAPQTVEQETQIQSMRLAEDGETDDIVLMWPESGQSGLNLFYRTYDARRGVWSKKVKLTDDEDLEKNPSLAIRCRRLLAIYLKDELRQTEQNIVELGDTALAVLEAEVAPDLTIEELTVSNPNAQPGERVTLVANVVNKGVLRAESVPLEVLADGTVIGRAVIPLLPPDPEESREVLLDWVVPHSGSAIALTATVDPSNGIEELNETNNTSRLFVRAPDLALLDLQVVGPSAPLTLEGQAVAGVILSATVANRGATPSAATALSLSYNRLDAETGQSLVRLMVPSLEPGEQTVLEYLWDLTTIPPGEYLLTAAIDGQSESLDADEGNNEFQLRTKLLPDLRISSFDIVRASSGRIEVNVANDGLHSAVGARINIIDAQTGAQLATSTMTITPQRSKKISVNVPSSLSAVIVSLDPEGEMEELDKSNNVASRSF